MARHIFRLPDIGEGIARAEIVAWHVRVGATVAEDARIADMMTDKATIELESPVSGTVVELAGEPGDEVAIGAMLAVIETDEEAETEILPATGRGTARSVVEGESAVPTPLHQPAAGPPPQIELGEDPRKVLASPAVRARARDLGIDLAQVRGEGDHIRHADLDAFLRYGAEQGYRATPAAPRLDETVKVIGLRRRIADAMAESKRHIPHFTYVEEIEVTALEGLRAQLNAGRGARPKLSLLPFLITALCRAMPDWPMMNARYDDAAGIVTRHGAVHVGIATQTGAGLVVPVLRDAQALNIWQLAQGIARVAEAARSGKAASADLSGSTITVSSLGALGGIASTPVINRPEVAILAPNRIMERPVFDGDDRVRRALLMNLSISCDHRVVDGWDAASFVQALKRLLESPALLLAP